MRLYQINKKRVFFKTNHFSDKLNPYNLSKIFSKFVYNRLKLYSCEIKLGKTKNNYRSLTQINKFTCKKFNLHIFLKLQYLLRQIELKIDCAFPNLSNFRPGNKTLCENWKKLSFILKYSHMNEKSHPIIVYYAPRKKKTWTVHISRKLPPEPKARMANTRCGLANFTPVERILFFTTRRVKCVLYALRTKNSLRILCSS